MTVPALPSTSLTIPPSELSFLVSPALSLASLAAIAPAATVPTLDLSKASFLTLGLVSLDSFSKES